MPSFARPCRSARQGRRREVGPVARAAPRATGDRIQFNDGGHRHDDLRRARPRCIGRRYRFDPRLRAGSCSRRDPRRTARDTAGRRGSRSGASRPAQSQPSLSTGDRDASSIDRSGRLPAARRLPAQHVAERPPPQGPGGEIVVVGPISPTGPLRAARPSRRGDRGTAAGSGGGPDHSAAGATLPASFTGASGSSTRRACPAPRPAMSSWPRRPTDPDPRPAVLRRGEGRGTTRPNARARPDWARAIVTRGGPRRRRTVSTAPRGRARSARRAPRRRPAWW